MNEGKSSRKWGGGGRGRSKKLTMAKALARFLLLPLHCHKNCPALGGELGDPEEKLITKLCFLFICHVPESVLVLKIQR